MPAQLIDGEVIAAGIREQLKKDVEQLKSKGVAPTLAAVIATDNRGARIYADNQAKSCAEVGIDYKLVELPPTSTEPEVIAGIQKLNADPAIHGIIIQMPLPEGVDARRLQMMIAPGKDAEGMSPANQGRVLYAPQPFPRKPKESDMGEKEWLEKSLGWPLPAPAPCTPIGAMTLIRSLGMDLYGKEAVVVGHSEIVGKPLGLLLVAHFCTTSWCHIATKDLAAQTKRADILCVAVGKAGLVKANMIKPGAVVIDIGINRVPEIGPDGQPVLNPKGKPKMKTVGDVDFDGAKEVAGWITPVPGGVGPMTVVMLLRNTVEAAKAAAR
jgi:methylenetetrahydrofolate dehydrogenase (NADP+)/methenyltetrahydrofolate cyclohydrolase